MDTSQYCKSCGLPQSLPIREDNRSAVVGSFTDCSRIGSPADSIRCRNSHRSHGLVKGGIVETPKSFTQIAASG